MDFYEVLEQVLVLLQRHGRVSYRALKRQFDLDDEALEDLKEELLFAHPVVDEDGRGLVWTGETGAPTEPTASSTRPAQLDVTQEAQPTQVASPPLEPPTPDAERRQLTVMFCDLVGSTPLSEQLDPEDLREVVRAYQQTCAEVVQRYDGHIAQLLGDALLVYFGWPQAHEDDAQRAVRTGLGMLDAMGTLNARLEQDKSTRLAIRVGIHTGLVVVGEMGGGDHQEQLALGDTPNVTARLQGLAEPDTVVISEATSRLVEGYFTVEDLGLHTLKGVAVPMQMYRVLHASGAQSRLEVASPRGLTPLVGRESEVTILLDRWNQVKDGQGQVVLLSGEGGIGKSRLVHVLKDHVADEPHFRWECRCSSYFHNSALYPVIDLFQRAFRFQRDDTPREKQRKMEETLAPYVSLPDVMPLFASMLSVPLDDCYPPLTLPPERQKQKTLEAVLTLLLAVAAQQPVLFILEDLHWLDPSTLELLDLLIEQTPTAQIFILFTCRPAFQPTWSHRSYLTEVTLNRLSRSQIAQMAERIADGKNLPAEVLQQIVEKTDGVPLFVEEITKAVLESGVLQAVDGHYELVGSLTSLTIPSTLHDSLMARLDRLVTAKGVAQLGAVIGRQFSYELLQAVSQLDEVTLQRELRRLVEAELFYQRGLSPQATYTFKHALIQDTAYHSLLKSTRQQVHQRVARVVATQFPDTAETQPELLAHHYTEAGLHEQAVGYWQRAGEHAVRRSAYAEAIAHLSKGLEVLKTVPDTPERRQQELHVLATLRRALATTKGYAAPELERVISRLHELCQQLEESPHIFGTLMGLWAFHHVRAEYQMAREVAVWFRRLAQRQRDPALLLGAHHAQGSTLYLLGEVASAHAHYEQGMALYDPQQHRVHTYSTQNLGVTHLTGQALTLWLLGYPDQALERIHEARTLARGLSHPFSMAFALRSTTHVHQLRREWEATAEQAEATVALSTEHGFAFLLAWGTILRGKALSEQGGWEEGMAQIRQGLAAWEAMGNMAWRPYFLALLAEAYGKDRKVGEGLNVLTEALALVDKTGERCCEAELYRLKGDFLLELSSDSAVEAEMCFLHAVDIAKQQQAKSWELRAATSLARLWQQQGKRQDAYDLLAPVYNWFTEGFDTADLKEAKALLDELSEDAS